MSWERIVDEADLVLWVPRAEGDGAEVAMPFRRIPAGEFRMGARGYEVDEEPAHRVVVAEDFHLASVAVTQEQFACWTGTLEYGKWFAENEGLIRETSYGDDKAVVHSNHFGNCARRPSENVTWWEAWAFGKWLREKCHEQVVGGHFVRLPTEAEWEYGCRAGTETDYSSGDGEEALRRVGWYDGNADGSTHEVGELASNERGLHDMHGNVWEWCADAWEDGVYRQRAGGDEVRCQSGEKGANRVVRGGSWYCTAWWCRAAFRAGGGPGSRGRIRGFRLGLFPGPEVFPVNSKQQAETGTAESQPGGGSGAGAAAQRKPEGRDAARLAEIDDAEDNPA